MMVPTYRLMIWLGLILLPLSVSAGRGSLPALLFMGTFTLLLIVTVIDAVMAFGRMEGIHVAFPEVAHMSKGREGKMTLFIKNEKMKGRRIRLGLAFPAEIQTPDQTLLVKLPDDSPASSISWPCLPKKQGRYVINGCHMELNSPLGLWSVRSRSETRSEIRVYPNLLIERKNLASLFLYQRLGIHKMNQIGKGREFEQLREYLPGDSFDDIHWKATAKRNYPVTKTYQIERTQEVYIIIDNARLSTRHVTGPERDPDRGGDTAIVDRFVTAALILGLVAIRQGDLFGLLTFSDRVQRFVRAKSGKSHYNLCRDALYTMHPQDVSPDFDELFTFIGLKLRRRALLIFLTNLDDPVLAEGFMHHLPMISKKHLVLVNMLRPLTARSLFSSSSVTKVHDLYRALAGHITRESLRKTEKALQRQGIGFFLLNNEKMSVQLVTQYLNIKQKQRL
ncbi:MAG: DUF58 domain-containing protein [Pseudomonadota bacterium]